MPSHSNYYEETGKYPVYRQRNSDILAGAKPPIPQEIQEQMKLAQELGVRQGFKIVRGLGSPLTSQRWYVCVKTGSFSYDFAPGCERPIGFKEGGFKTLEEAIECFEKLEA